jgi:1-acyl-sn-glycerol-3-phosphate acyltransferase
MISRHGPCNRSAAHATVSSGNQFSLLRERRFLPFFLAQASGAFNDNLFKNALIVLVTYQASTWSRWPPEMLANVAGGLFILPFVLLSGMAGQMSERFDKSRVIKLVKLFEVAIMAMAGVGFAAHHLAMLLGALFLMGVHSTFFAPAKYGLLPELLDAQELVGGNALLEMGTFLAILLGTLAAGVLAARTDIHWVTGAMLLTAVLGFAISLAMPPAVPAAPGQRIDWNPWTSSLDNIRAARASRTVFLSVLGLSWFWFYGALVLVQLPIYCKSVLHASGSLVTLTIVVFSVGVGVGSLLCERLSGHKVEIGLVPFGSIGLTLFALDWVLASPRPPGPISGIPAFLALDGAWRTLFDLAAIGLFGGFFVVPLNATVQQRARPQTLSRIIGANSILNALFMVGASLLGALGAALGLSVLQLVLIAAVLNAVVAVYIYTLVPEFLLRFIAWLLVHTLYRLRKTGMQHIPEQGAALLVCNHVSFVDALLVSAATRRPIRFIMDEAIFHAPLISVVTRGMKAIPIASAKADPEVYEQAFVSAAQALRAGELVCIFPEGRLTPDGQIGEFRPGLMRILKETPVPVVPMALVGLWGSMFSRRSRNLWQRLPRKLGARIDIHAGAPWAARDVTPEVLRAQVALLFETAGR